jgi:hypothetical protein
MQPSSKTAHYEGSDFVIFGKTRADWDRIVRAIQYYHMHVSPEGYSDIAYNFVVSPIGDVYEGRGWQNRSAANGSNDGNANSLAICYIGGPTTPFTAEAQGGFHEIGDQVRGPWYPHHRWFNTSCPGPLVDAWLNLGEPPAKPCSCPVEPSTPSTPSTALEKFVAATTKGKLEDQDHRGVLLTMQRNPIFNADVQAVQDAFNLTSNAHLVPDGKFGFATLGAVTDLQRFWKLTVDGVVGIKTRQVLELCIAKEYEV